MIKFKRTTLPNPWMIFLATAFGISLASIDGGIVNVALPTFSKDFHVQMSSLQWVITSYLLAVCILTPLCGRLGDIYSKRSIYLTGMIIFTLFSALCGLSSNLESLIIFRSLQGVGAAFLLGINQAILMTNFPKEKQAQALGINSMVFSLSGLIGPTLGGFLIQFFNWRSIFLVNIPIGIIGSYMCLKILPLETLQSREKIDFAGTLLFAIGITCLLCVFVHGPEWHWHSFKSLFFLSFGILTLILFYEWQLYVPFPIIDFDLFKNRLFFSGNVIVFFVLSILVMNMFLLPFYLQQILNQSPMMSGLFLFIPPIFIMAITPACGHYTSPANASKLVLIGIAIITLGWITQLFYNSSTSLWIIIASQMLLGIGYGTFQTPNNFSILYSVSPEKMGISSGVTSFSKNISKVIGVSFCVAIFQLFQNYYVSTSRGSIHDVSTFMFGYKAVILSALALLFVTIALTFWQAQTAKKDCGLRAED